MRQTEKTTMESIRQILAVSGVLFLLAACLWWLRKKGLTRYRSTGSRRQNLQAVERLMLGPQYSLHLVRLAGRGLLVATSPAGCAVLESFDWNSIESRASSTTMEAR
jgi:flagellar biogenesis protein FliO